MGKTRRSRVWDSFLISKIKADPFQTQKTKREARQKRALNIKRILPFYCNSQEIDGEMHHVTNMNAHMIVGQNYVALKMPYGLSLNDIWRATIDERGVQRNSLSVAAKSYKLNIVNMYEPLVHHIDFEKINELCEIRIIAQPPLKTRNYTAKSYPRFDIDNYPKIILDSLKGLIFKDDNIFIHEQIKLAEPVEDGCVWVSCIFMQESDTNWVEEPINFDWLTGRARAHGI